MDCIFCDIVKGKKQGYIIYEDNDHLSFLDKFPIDIGHSLVIPKQHYEQILDMDYHKVGHLFTKVSKIAKAIMIGTSADAFSLGQNNGKAAKQVIPHVHVHIIPRYNKKNTTWTKRTIGNNNELNILATKIKKIINY